MPAGALRLPFHIGPALGRLRLPLGPTFVSAVLHVILLAVVIVGASMWSDSRSKQPVYVVLAPATAAIGSPQGVSMPPPRVEEPPAPHHRCRRRSSPGASPRATCRHATFPRGICRPHATPSRCRIAACLRLRERRRGFVPATRSCRRSRAGRPRRPRLRRRRAGRRPRRRHSRSARRPARRRAQGRSRSASPTFRTRTTSARSPGRFERNGTERRSPASSPP